MDGRAAQLLDEATGRLGKEKKKRHKRLEDIRLYRVMGRAGAVRGSTNRSNMKG